MGMHDGEDFAFVFSGGPVVGIQQKELTGTSSEIATGAIALAAFDDHQQTTRFAGVLGLCVL
jgi:hypothetical protein